MNPDGEMLILFKNLDKYIGTVDKNNKFHGKGKLEKQ